MPCGEIIDLADEIAVLAARPQLQAYRQSRYILASHPVHLSCSSRCFTEDIEDGVLRGVQVERSRACITTGMIWVGRHTATACGAALTFPWPWPVLGGSCCSPVAASVHHDCVEKDYRAPKTSHSQSIRLPIPLQQAQAGSALELLRKGMNAGQPWRVHDPLGSGWLSEL